MRTPVLGLLALAALAACSRAPSNAASPASNTPANAAAASAPATTQTAAAGVSGTYAANGKAAKLTEVAAYKGDPFDGKSVTDVVFSTTAQTGSEKPAMDALFGQFGDALVVHVEADDGTVVGTELVHSGFKDPKGSVSVSGPIKLINYHNEDGMLAGEITTGGETDVFDDKVTIDLTFKVKAP